ncbi:hypothetical protein E4U41_003217 [Claviceps citrina]|nr:hypothetical protein E4U41_003217 [Claviceps citrina]
MTPAKSTEGAKFVTCEAYGCNFSSGIGDLEACTLRLGFEKCLVHLEEDEIKERKATIGRHRSIIPVYYDVQLSNDGQIEQIGACTKDGHTFSGLIRTSINTDKAVVKNPTIVLVAHYGVLSDHLHLLRTMLRHGVRPPGVHLSDSVAIYKMMEGKDQTARLAYLRDKLMPWIEHVPHDADSEAKALMRIMHHLLPDPRLIYSRFCIECGEYLKLVGLDMCEVTRGGCASLGCGEGKSR